MQKWLAFRFGFLRSFNWPVGNHMPQIVLERLVGLQKSIENSDFCLSFTLSLSLSPSLSQADTYSSSMYRFKDFQKEIIH